MTQNKCCLTCEYDSDTNNKACPVKILKDGSLNYARREFFFCNQYTEIKKKPSHYDIMTKWWEGTTTWLKVVAYNPESKTYATITNPICVEMEIPVEFRDKYWFIDRKSADLPPEV